MNNIEHLLVKDFIEHYNNSKNLPVVINLEIRCTREEHFSLKDDDKLIYATDEGVAKFLNPDRREVVVLNYEKFKNSLPSRVSNQLSKGKCDVLLYSKDYFLLNELTDTQKRYIDPYNNLKGFQDGKLAKAQQQLEQSLQDLINVPKLNQCIQMFAVRRCCFFSKQPHTPQLITNHVLAVQAFNRLSQLPQTKGGFHLHNTIIEQSGFEFWEYSGEQTFILGNSIKPLSLMAKQLYELSSDEAQKLSGIIETDYGIKP
jgi:hypothetical protein